MPETTNFKLVDDEQRCNALYRPFPFTHLHFEDAIYNAASHFSEDYQCGFWDYYEAENGAFFMAPPEGIYRVFSQGNGFDGEMSAQAFGIALTMFINSHLSIQFYNTNTPRSEEQGKNYHRLRDVIEGHPEESKIFAFLD
jgi:hypothetical protein